MNMRATSQNLSQANSGQIIIFSLVLAALLMVASASVVSYTVLNLRQSRTASSGTQALYLAQAGIDKAINQLNLDANYSGETGTPLGAGELTVSVATLDGNNKRVTSTAYIPDNQNPLAVRTVKATVNITTADISFNNGVQVGEGGLSMGNNSSVEGNVFSNGSISGSGEITGDVIVADNLPAAPDQFWEAQNADFNFGNISARRDAAQSFVPSVSGKLTAVSAYLRKVGNPGDLTVRIMTDSSGKPSKTSLASANLSASRVTGTYDFFQVPFSSPPNVTAGTKYWIMLSAASINAGNYFFWGFDTTDGYAANTAKYSASWNAGSPVWNLANGDLNFRAYIGGSSNSLSGVTVSGNAWANTLSNCNISGDAYYLVISSCSVGGTLNPDTEVPGPEAMPISDAQIEAWKTVAEGGGTLPGPYSVTGTQTLGPVKIDGDFIVTNGVTLIVTGPIWVKGNMNISNNAIVRISGGLGNAGTVIFADNPSNPSGSGKVTVSNNVTITGNGNPNSFPLILSGSTAADAMNISNNSLGAIYYAARGTLNLSNNAGGYQITGYKIVMSNNSTISYVNGLQNAFFSNGPGGSWTFLPGSFAIEP